VLVVALVVVVAAGSVATFVLTRHSPAPAATPSPRVVPASSPTGSAATGPLQLTAQSISFSPTGLTASATAVAIHFTNQDAGIPYNVAVFDGSDVSAPVIFRGAVITGPGSTDYTFVLPGPGTYFFHCDVHPTQMTGDITLEGPSPSPSSGVALGTSPAKDPAELAAQLEQAQAVIDTPSSSSDEISAVGRLEQLIYRRLAVHPDLRDPTYALLSGDVATTRAVVDAVAELISAARPQPAFPDWTVSPGAPATTLLSFYQEGERETGIPWQYLAAINLLETRFGRIHVPATAPAQGPMQFLAGTWATYGQGNIDDDRDAILAAARLLSANGGPTHMASALRSYNSQSAWNAAVQAFAHQMMQDPRTYDALYGWQVIYPKGDGAFIIPIGYPHARPRRVRV
jgi:plastocyanin